MTDLLRSMNRFVLAAGLGASLALAGPALASAQDDGGAPHLHRRHHRMRFARMAGELGLTPEQEAQVRSVMAEAREEGRALREMPRGEERREARRALRQRVRGELRAILTPEQQEQARELRAQHREQRAERRVARMQERLGLSDAQADQVRTILERARARRQQIRATTEPGEARREAMRALHQRVRNAIRGLLTPEQAEQLDAMRAHFRRGDR